MDALALESELTRRELALDPTARAHFRNPQNRAMIRLLWTAFAMDQAALAKVNRQARHLSRIRSRSRAASRIAA